MQLEEKELLRYFLGILKARDYSAAELIDKAMKKTYDSVTIKTVLSYLHEKKLVSDARLAENIITSYKHEKGKLWLIQKLKSRQIPEEIWSEMLLEAEDFDELGSLKQKILNKFKLSDFSTLDYKLKTKIIAYLARQGFSNPWDILSSWGEK